MQLLEHAWDFAYENRSNVVDVYVRYLREKIDRPLGPARSRRCAASAIGCRQTLDETPADRVRLTLVFTLAMAIVLAGAAWFLYLRVGSELAAGIDQSLRSRAQDVGALVGDGGSLRGTGSPLIEPGESFAELLGANGRVRGKRLARWRGAAQWRGSGPRAPWASVPRLGPPRAAWTSLRACWRFRSAGGVLVVGVTRENRAETLRSLRGAFFVGGPIALLLADARRVRPLRERPCDRLRRCAVAQQEISTSLARRAAPGSGGREDEVARLGETLNPHACSDRGRPSTRERPFVSDASHELRTPLALVEDGARARSAQAGVHLRS